jgi:hypothetical protein
MYPPDSPVDSGGGNTPSGDMGKEDIIEFLNDDSDKDEPIDLSKDKDIKSKSKPKEEEEEEVIDDTDEDQDEDTVEEIDEIEELELELKEPKDEDLELVTPVRRKEILAKYPQLFKDFPYLEKAYYREQKYTELLPTIDDAKEAVSKAKTLDQVETDLRNGKTENLLKAARGNTKAFAKIVDDYLPALSRVDEKAYHHVIGNTIRHTIMAMVNEARTSKNNNLEAAAQILNQFVFASSNFTPPSLLSDTLPEDTKVTSKEKELQEQERKFNVRKIESANQGLSERVNGTLRATISAHIDPKQSMSDYVRKNASKDAFDELKVAIDKDRRFGILVDKLWEKAISDDFSSTSMERIRGAFISKARTLLPSVIKKARNEALRGTGKRVPNDDTEVSSNGSSKKNEKPHSFNSGQKSSKGKIPSGMTSLEYLMSDD